MTDTKRATLELSHINTQGSLTKLLRRVLGSILGLLPSNTPVYVYTVLLKPKPLRALANAILRTMIPERLNIPEGVLFLNHDDPVVSGALMLGAYEPYFTKVFREKATQGKVVVDIGANLGYYTLIASKNAERVIAYEPEEENLRLLRKTMAANQRDNIRIMPVALGAREESLTLWLHADNKGKHSLLPETENNEAASVTIPVTTLDRSLTTLGVAHVDLIKMDIEGWESHALDGAHETLEQSHPTVMFEFGPERIRRANGDPVGMLQHLVDMHYSLFVIDERARKLVRIEHIETLIHSLPGFDDYTNIIAMTDSTSEDGAPTHT